MTVAKPAPERLIDDRGQVTVGLFDHPVGDVNHEAYDLRTPMGRQATWLGRWFGFNQFQFIGVMSPTLVLGCAIVDTRYVGAAFVYCWDPTTQTLEEHSFRRMLGIGTRLATTPDKGIAGFQQGTNIFQMMIDEAKQELTLIVRLNAGLKIDAVVSQGEPPIQPLCLATRAGATGWVYTQKTAGVPVRGKVTWKGGEVDLASSGALAIRDWSAGYMRRETFWNWASCAGRLADGRRFGLNLASGVNETGFTENCFWLDGRLVKVDSVHFDYDRGDLDRPWRITSQDGRIDLTFTPEACHAERVNAWILASNFHQLFGRLKGTVREGDQTIPIDGLLGFVEEHFARW